MRARARFTPARTHDGTAAEHCAVKGHLQRKSNPSHGGTQNAALRGKAEWGG